MMNRILMICTLMVLPLQFALAGLSMPKMPDTSKFTSKFKMPQAGGDAAKKLPKGVNFSKPSSMPKKPNYIPHVYLGGYGGYNGWTALGQADVLLPVLTRYDRTVFLYGQGRYSTDTRSWAKNPWTGSIGAGYRQIFAHEIVLGGYVLGDYTSTSSGHTVMLASPGFEALTQNWDFRVNGYFPIGTTSWSNWEWASDCNDYSHIIQRGHIIYDAKYIFNEETGMGADAEVGRKLFTIFHMPVKGFINGYYYHMNKSASIKVTDNNPDSYNKETQQKPDALKTKTINVQNKAIYGGGARITIDPNAFLRFSISDSYDSHRKNSVIAGVRVSINDIFSHRDRDNVSLQNRILEPIERNFGSIANASTARETGGMDDQIATHVVDAPPNIPNPPLPYVKDDNAWYFGSAANDKRHPGDDGTIEHPYTAADFDQDTLNKIRDYNNTFGYTHSELYLATGTYTNVHTLQFPEAYTFSILGVESDLKTPAAGSDRPMIQGELYLPKGKDIKHIQLDDLGYTTNANGIYIGSGAKVDIEDIAITNEKNTDSTGISVNNAQAVTLKDVDIGSDGKTNNYYTTGIDIENAGAVTLSNVTIFHPGYDINKRNKIGLNIQNVVGDVTIDKLNIGQAEEDEKFNYLTGISLKKVATAKDAKININASTIYAGANDSKDAAVGISYIDSGELSINHDTINVKTAGGSDSNTNNAYAIKSADNANLTLTNTGINVTTSGGGSGSANAYGISLGKNSTVNMDGGSIAVKTGDGAIANGKNSGNAYGIKIAGQNDDGKSSTIDVGINNHKSTITVTAKGAGDNSGNSYGIVAGDGMYNPTEDGKISSNTITVESGSSVSSEVNSFSNGSHGGNAYGVLVGYGYSSINDTSKGDIENNYVNIHGSGSTNTDTISAIVTANSSSAKTQIDTGNAFGVLVGYNYGGFGGQTKSAHIQNDHITIDSNASITGSGLNARSYSATSDDNVNSGNGYGVVLGYGMVDVNSSTPPNVDFSISKNTLDIDNATITATGHLNHSSVVHSDFYAGRGIGVLVGFGDIKTSMTNNYIIGGNTTELGNIITMNNSMLNSTSYNNSKRQIITTSERYHQEYLNAKNMGYGLLVGYGGGYPAGTNIGSINNHVDVENCKVNTTTAGYDISTAGVCGAVGIEVGNYNASNIFDDNNNVTILHDTFKADTTSDNVFTNYPAFYVGYYMPEASGKLTWYTKEEIYGGNKFYRYNGYSEETYGYGLSGQDKNLDYYGWNPSSLGHTWRFKF